MADRLVHLAFVADEAEVLRDSTWREDNRFQMLWNMSCKRKGAETRQ